MAEQTPDSIITTQRNGQTISTTERYAELSQGTVNRHIRDWNEKWFSQQKESSVKRKKENPLPDFLK